LVDGNRPARNALRQILTLHQFHHQRISTVRLLKAVDLRDVGVVQCCECLGLTLEPGEAIGVLREGIGKNLDCDLLTEVGVSGAIDLAHPTCADAGHNLVGSKASTGCESHSLNPLAQLRTTVMGVDAWSPVWVFTRNR